MIVMTIDDVLIPEWQNVRQRRSDWLQRVVLLRRRIQCVFCWIYCVMNTQVGCCCCTRTSNDHMKQSAIARVSKGLFCYIKCTMLQCNITVCSTVLRRYCDGCVSTNSTFVRAERSGKIKEKKKIINQTWCFKYAWPETWCVFGGKLFTRRPCLIRSCVEPVLRARGQHLSGDGRDPGDGAAGESRRRQPIRCARGVKASRSACAPQGRQRDGAPRRAGPPAGGGGGEAARRRGRAVPARNGHASTSSPTRFVQQTLTATTVFNGLFDRVQSERYCKIIVRSRCSRFPTRLPATATDNVDGILYVPRCRGRRTAIVLRADNERVLGKRGW